MWERPSVPCTVTTLSGGRNRPGPLCIINFDNNVMLPDNAEAAEGKGLPTHNPLSNPMLTDMY